VALLTLLCLVLGLLCFAGAAFNVVAGRINFIALGLAFWIFTAVLAAWPK
jgi:hypothetical protein